MASDQSILIVGAGLFGLSLAKQLASDGHKNITIVDRHVPPVADGSSNDISRVIRFDYGDKDYMTLANEAYVEWFNDSRYQDIFNPTPFVLVCSDGNIGSEWVARTKAALDYGGHPWTAFRDANDVRQKFPVLSGDLCPDLIGYMNPSGGWADAAKGITLLRDDCIALGVSFTCGSSGTITGFEVDDKGKILAAKTLNGHKLQADRFVLAAGSWSASLVPMYNSTLSTAQVVGYMRLSDAEMEQYKMLPLYINSTTGWFNFPPHTDTRMLKVAVHGWGYTRTPTKIESSTFKTDISAPPLFAQRRRPNFVPADGESRLTAGLQEILPELAKRPFDRLALCWYTDTPSGDFIVDDHPDYQNLFVANGGSGHAYKFLPVLGKYVALGFEKRLPSHLAEKWRFRMEYAGQDSAFKGDGSRGGPPRRDLRADESAKL